jgi:NAD(P)H-hydrate epimerase
MYKLLFATLNGVAVPAVTTEQMRDVDRIAVEETGPNLFQMMENAGRSLAIQAIDMIGDNWKQPRILILAGTGGNGGGGICAARHLTNRGANVGLVLTNEKKLNSAAAWQAHIYAAAGGRFIDPADLAGENPNLIIDTVIGYSLKGAPGGIAKDLIGWCNSQAVPVLSLDIPSGIDSTTAETPGIYVNATRTMTLALPKIGLINPAAGEIMLADIGIPATTFDQAGISYQSPFGGDFMIPLRRTNAGR